MPDINICMFGELFFCAVGGCAIAGGCTGDVSVAVPAPGGGETVGMG